MAVTARTTDGPCALTAVLRSPALPDTAANEVVVARDGGEAFDYLCGRGKFADRAPGLPALMLPDISLPDGDGLGVRREMEADAGLKKIPVVMRTSSREEPDPNARYALGANAHVVKPVDCPQFLDAVRAVGAFWSVLNEPPGCLPPPPA